MLGAFRLRHNDRDLLQCDKAVSSTCPTFVIALARYFAANPVRVTSQSASEGVAATARDVKFDVSTIAQCVQLQLGVTHVLRLLAEEAPHTLALTPALWPPLARQLADGPRELLEPTLACIDVLLSNEDDADCVLDTLLPSILVVLHWPAVDVALARHMRSVAALIARCSLTLLFMQQRPSGRHAGERVKQVTASDRSLASADLVVARFAA